MDSLFQLSDCPMELKDYQQQTLDTLDRYLEALKEARQQADQHNSIRDVPISLPLKCQFGYNRET